MNPLLIADAAKKTGKGIKEFANTEAGKQSVNFLGALIAGGLVYLGAKKYIERSRYNKWQADFGTNTQDGKAATYAARLHESFFPSGIEWFGHFDSTDEESAYKVASDMGKNGVSFVLVSKAYKGLYERDLLKDMTSEFSAKELKLFNSYLNPTNTKTVSTEVKQTSNLSPQSYHVVIDSKDGESLYKNVSSTYNIFSEYGRGYITKIFTNTYIGRWTGLEHKKFIQVELSIGGNIYRYWVDKEEVKLLTPTVYEQMKGSINTIRETQRRQIVSNA